MTSKLYYLSASSAIGLALVSASPAFAAGTTAGTDITNNVTVDYQVGGVDQTQETASDTFAVDRIIDLTVARVDDVATSVSPGQDSADTPPPVTTFNVTNTSNEVLDFALTAANQSGGASAIPGLGTDNFDASNLQIFVDSNGNGVYDPGTDTATFIDELAEDATIAVFVIGDIPVAQNTDDIATVTLRATAREGGTAGGSIGAAITESTGADTDGVETVFGDTAGDTDGNRDGAFSASDDFIVNAAAITVVKTSTVLWDPVNGSTNPRAIPGAVVEYCIAVSNASGGAPATNTVVSDDLTAAGTGITNVSFYSTTIASGPATIPAANGVVSALACDGTGTNADASALGESGGIVSGNLGSVAAGATETLIFRVTVD